MTPAKYSYPLWSRYEGQHGALVPSHCRAPRPGRQTGEAAEVTVIILWMKMRMNLRVKKDDNDDNEEEKRKKMVTMIMSLTTEEN